MDAALAINHQRKASSYKKVFVVARALIYAYRITIVALQLTKAFFIFLKKKNTNRINFSTLRLTEMKSLAPIYIVSPLIR